ncbi:hypothetical protein Daura_20450 [Dactylosporangium aurantiacum]|uniref:DUF4261 domain-containing protein n=1 Tax=Dactylosporangium aurantiacum TaxID=35754 RepID=A0A9Q9IMN3_9ACTN|nr:hypothetical protein [Dactylosporangium aurantiacum]MDG6106161.1 hypothetical protein [Dactylosporangium aurantiacum]UWZ58336.1 hypothetical protein Daura_20450 [Dactylosporangium aurantiacum]
MPSYPFRPQHIYPRHVLCVLGTGLDLDTVGEVVRAAHAGATFDPADARTAPDPRMPVAFQVSLANATFTDADVAAVAAHDTVAYVLSPPIHSVSAWTISGQMLALTAALLRAGATAVKNESSGLTHGRERWLAIADRAATAPTEDDHVVSLYDAWVKRPISDDDGVLFSCGMHLLGAPEVEIVDGTLDDVPTIDAFAGYLLLEDPVLHDGEGFRVAVDAPRWTVEHRPCDRYEEDSFFYNPFGAWRLTRDG